jgi:UDP-galactopyranose mutase
MAKQYPEYGRNCQMSLKILVVGAGLSGAAVARLLRDRGHRILVVEKEGCVGGLCITRISPNGLHYEPFGARTFHSRKPDIAAFVRRFADFNGYVHRKGIVIQGKLFPYPISRDSLSALGSRERIFRELENLPGEIDKTNFETAALSLFGETLYRLFIRNYSTRMWGVDPVHLPAEMAIRRLELRDGPVADLFPGEWQGLPSRGYSAFLESMLENIPVKLQTPFETGDGYDVVVSSAPIDEMLSYRFGRLAYRSLRFDYQADEPWEHDGFGTINLPQDETHIRKCNFKILHRQESRRSWIQYQEPVAAENGRLPMYPIATAKNEEAYIRNLREICTTRICPVGRLGFSKYLNMDQAVEVAFRMLPVIEHYPRLSPEARFEKITAVRADY